MAKEKTKKKFSFPSAFTILFLLLVVIALATWIVPAGSYDYDEYYFNGIKETEKKLSEILAEPNHRGYFYYHSSW